NSPYLSCQVDELQHATLNATLNHTLYSRAVALPWTPFAFAVSSPWVAVSSLRLWYGSSLLCSL
ncbi:MAG: hypothetical protein WCJ35_27570, partial [Planctomycetota bacterium]